MPPRFDVGARVHNAQLGIGEIVAVDGYGDKERLTINFESSGVRQVLSKYFLLETYDNELHTAPAEAEAPPRAPEPRPSDPRHPDPRPAAPEPKVARVAPADDPPSIAAIKAALRSVIREEMGVPTIQMMDRWEGGTIVLKPGREGLQDKVFPMDAFFHKIVMVRDRLRVLEQKINAHAQLSDSDKVDIQQYVTRIYGSLTTFNVLFADRDDWFVGQKDSDD